MIDKLIKKYKKRITKIENSDFPYWLFKTSSEEYFYNEGIKEVISTYKKIIKDLEELKEKINNLDITSINAPSIVITQILKNEIIGVDIDE